MSRSRGATRNRSVLRFGQISIQCLLVLILSSCGKNADAPVQPPPPEAVEKAPLIVGIHGLRPKPAKAILEPEWRKALHLGLEVNGHEDREFEFQLAHWAWRDRELRECRARRPSTAWDVRGKALEKTKELRSQDLGLSELTERLRGGDLDKLFELAHWDQAQEDLKRYYNDEEQKKAIQKSLIDILEKESGTRKILLIAHSMGSIVAYDVLRDGQFEIEHLITIGSPLGLQPIRARNGAGGEGTFGSVINNWTNLADPMDPIALDSDLNRDEDDETPDYDHPVEDILVNTWIPPEKSLTEAVKALVDDFSSEATGEVARRFLDLGKSQANLWGYHSYCGYMQTPQLAERVDQFLKLPD